MVRWRCPNCGESDCLRVVALVWVLLEIDEEGDLAGSEVDDPDHEWDDESAAWCANCDWKGKARDLYN
jgi:hypothetical protein